MTLAHPFRTLAALLAAFGLVVVPLANPLLLAACLILSGLLTAGRGAAAFSALLATETANRDAVLGHAF